MRNRIMHSADAIRGKWTMPTVKSGGFRPRRCRSSLHGSVSSRRSSNRACSPTSSARANAGGRKKGSRNRKTIEREARLRADLLTDVMEQLKRSEAGRAQIASGGGELANGGYGPGNGSGSGGGELANGGYGPGNGSGNGPAEPERPEPPEPPGPPPEPSRLPPGGASPPPHMGDLRPLAKDELANLVPITKTVVAAFQRAAWEEDGSGAPDKENFDPAKWTRFQVWLKVFIDLCKSVAEYESPKYKPIEVTSGQAAVDEAERRGKNEVTVVIRGGLPEPDAMVELKQRASSAEGDGRDPGSAGRGPQGPRPAGPAHA
jgi:hypothetical protein